MAIETVLAGVTAVVSVASAGYGVAQGMQQAAAARSAADDTARQYEDQRKAAAIEAEQREAANRADLERVMGAAVALRGARGLDPYGAPGSSGLALRDASIQDADADLNLIQYGSLQRGRQISFAGAQAAAAGERQAMQGFANAFQSGGQFLSSAQTAAKVYDAATRPRTTAE